MSPARAGGSRVARPAVLPAVGAVAVWILFAALAGSAFRGIEGTAAWINAAAPLGLLAVAVALLMIGGEFDLSVGSIVGLAGMTLLLLTTRFGWPLFPAVAATLALSVGLGVANGVLVVRTGLPSFLVTLGTLFVYRGLAIALSRRWTGRTQLGGLDEVAGYDLARAVFGADLPGGLRSSLVWWVAAVAIGAWLLARTRAGNWILATGGDADAARRAGVPVERVKLSLFATTALAGGVVAVLQAVRFTGADALRGELMELRAIAAAVIGGTLLTGGYGSAIGAAIGALVLGMTQQGIVMAGVDGDWFQVVLGIVLLGAVLLNHRVRSRLGSE